jgi:hypothetical protein
MAYEMLQAVIGAAVIDSEFRKALMNGSRRLVVENFDLTHEEVNAVMSIRADTLEQFAEQLDQWIMEQQNQIEPPTLDLPAPPHVARKKSRAHEKSARLRTKTDLHTLVISHSSSRAC